MPWSLTLVISATGNISKVITSGSSGAFLNIEGRP